VGKYFHSLHNVGDPIDTLEGLLDGLGNFFFKIRNVQRCNSLFDILDEFLV